MADRNIYTRVYSGTSAGGLISGKESTGELSSYDLLDEFRNHAERWRSDRPTALVSTSSRIVDTLLRAFTKHYTEREPAEDIWIVFLELPGIRGELPDGCHAASDLARECKRQNPEAFSGDKINMFCYEFVFEREVPEEYVLHKVSLETLKTRGLDWGEYFDRWDTERQGEEGGLSTSTLRGYIAEELLGIKENSSSWEVGLRLGLDARAFGARAPTQWVASQLYHDCVKGIATYKDDLRVIYYANGHHEILRKKDVRFGLELMDDGIDHALIYWWLEDFGVSDEYLEFEWWRDMMEEATMYDSLEFRKTQERIEVEAVRLGL